MDNQNLKIDYLIQQKVSYLKKRIIFIISNLIINNKSNKINVNDIVKTLYFTSNIIDYDKKYTSDILALTKFEKFDFLSHMFNKNTFIK